MKPNKKVTLSADETQNIKGQIRFVKIITATGDVGIKGYSNGRQTEQVVLVQGRSYHFDELQESIDITNGLGVNQTIEYIVATGRVDDDTVAADVTVIKGDSLSTTADNNIAANSQELILAANSARRFAHITNLDSAIVLRWGDANTTATRGAVLWPGMTLVVESNAAIYVFNTDAALTVDVAITEELD